MLDSVIKNNYNISFDRIVKNSESTDGNVYIIDNNYVFKIYSDIKKAKSIIKIHTYLKDFYIPKVIKNKYNEYYTNYDNKIIVMFTYLDGIQIENIELNSDIVVKLASELRKLHDLTSYNKYDLDEIYVNKNLRSSLLHFDLTKQNIFYNDKIGFIDFDDAKYGNSIFDISILISFLFIRKSSGINKYFINLFLDSYYENNIELKNEEIKYIKKCTIIWIKNLLSNNNFNSSIKESLEYKLKMILKEEWK